MTRYEQIMQKAIDQERMAETLLHMNAPDDMVSFHRVAAIKYRMQAAGMTIAEAETIIDSKDYHRQLQFNF